MYINVEIVKANESYKQFDTKDLIETSGPLLWIFHKRKNLFTHWRLNQLNFRSFHFRIHYLQKAIPLKNFSVQILSDFIVLNNKFLNEIPLKKRFRWSPLDLSSQRKIQNIKLIEVGRELVLRFKFLGQPINLAEFRASPGGGVDVMFNERWTESLHSKKVV